MAYREAARLDELWTGELRGVVIDGVPVLLVRSERGVHAYHDRCLHQGVRLSEGALDGETITCGAHGWSYHACTGQGVNPSNVCLRAFPLRVVDGVIEVDVGGAAPASGAGGGPRWP